MKAVIIIAALAVPTAAFAPDQPAELELGSAGKAQQDAQWRENLQELLQISGMGRFLDKIQAVKAHSLDAGQTLTWLLTQPVINLSRMRWDYSDSEMLAFIVSKNDRLTALNLEKNYISDQGAKEIATALKGNVVLT